MMAQVCVQLHDETSVTVFVTLVTRQFDVSCKTSIKPSRLILRGYEDLHGAHSHTK